MSNKCPLKPVNKFVVIKDVVEQKKSGGGIIIPPDSRDVTHWAEVVAVCEGSKYEVGKTYVYQKFSETKVKIRGVTWSLITEDNILAEVTGDQPEFSEHWFKTLGPKKEVTVESDIA